MNGPHDLGGQHGLGPIVREEPEPVFHEPWERRAFALTLATGFLGRWNIDAVRHARENRHPVDYLSSSYYEIWFKGLERLVQETGLVTPEEIAAGRALEPVAIKAAAPDAATTAAILKKGVSARVAADVPARFAPGDRVLVRDINTAGHTRAPRYCRGRAGTVRLDHGVFVFPDTHAHGQGTKPQHVYSVEFEARTLWGADAPAHDRVRVDLWDDYLEPAR